ncbi:glutamyl-tRNA(Gln) amidotransferase subunit C, mitochondrial isoform X2 [Anopheles moucheti]|uniref:glutamyl-tRNA(Gln) amidotransferase subunit C, mitochondrial isoform X2 n=1 Tax=Anopheles moucheti TaxID=186751 RepID=UPI0022F0CF47|nr:glutamyl-tRNA(Gln) amidotransferase subunit C, mitochondrial isoform X2 [Anopheles moucheti]
MQANFGAVLIVIVSKHQQQQLRQFVLMFAAHLNMLRGIASRLSLRMNSTLHATPKPVSENRKSTQSWPEKRFQHQTKVPQQPHRSETSVGKAETSSIAISQETVQLLERLSLVNLDSGEALGTLQDSIEFASRVLPIDTNGVEPLYCVLEQEKLTLRSDTVDDGNLQAEVLQNATLVEEEYFVAPPGNIPLEHTDRS